ncbi:phosphoadenosine phosphosulfate reductase family protein [Pseudomonas aeruginosa]|uniref:phosphoadenosine phosphosulfate reductase domain-containing protein n=1 Tax=Pseudomonas aeruginosa TaxID=287 RepID=UPI0003BB05D2|nr:phosphoadenosine phosphosulfate reductase family protein [Pseudomonas aeruginosa]AYZ47977.1 phosphoadenosine phosphosulfate reductase [Pseudomonas aeruginosa]AYZ60347.1 phosphoadenosine phosphosulfate reductase [Pseudomonas aeruginosa]EIU4464714.1 phosphoadenosine phosphosulfate reductase family protein [Pseudomonas aeruginosa]EIU4714807.1 phosphoadenosine phosphosulfate reductase family protein [Pseudomonas aeruginosa]EIU4773481.1 phosphoadenosine phosphosulfate reductase family protein [P
MTAFSASTPSQAIPCSRIGADLVLGEQHNIISVSGGKDSTATLLLAIAMEAPNIRGVFADTGNEHELTLEYIDYLEQVTGVIIERRRADFSRQIAGKRRYIETKWRDQGVAESLIEAALEVLQPTGIPFLDLCLWKGRFPSRKAQFCTEELKRNVIIEQVMLPLLDGQNMVLSWQGVRREESVARRYLPECDEVGGGLFNYRPILTWPVEAVFEAHRYAGVKPNPLYSQGMGRVGCMPCINCRKGELREIALRFPEHIDRIEQWEHLVRAASKRGGATFFAGSNAKHQGGSIKDLSAAEIVRIANIRQAVEWSRTTRGGIQYDLMVETDDASACSSAYGLCDGEWEPVNVKELAA